MHIEYALLSCCISHKGRPAAQTCLGQFREIYLVKKKPHGIHSILRHRLLMLE